MDEAESAVDYTHVYPLFGRAHVLDGLCCWCRPEIDPECAQVVIHNADN